jgi:hypothetical protein
MLFYARYDELDFDRLEAHRRIAEALEKFIAADRSPPRHVLLEIERHYEEAEEPVAAGRLLVEIADSTLREGADRETVANAERAVELLRMSLSDETVEDDDWVGTQDLLSRAIVLVLLGGDAGWRASDEEYSLGRLVALADEAETLASSDGLRANACFAKARVLTAFGELKDAVSTYQRALALAERPGHPLCGSDQLGAPPRERKPRARMGAPPGGSLPGSERSARPDAQARRDRTRDGSAREQARRGGVRSRTIRRRTRVPQPLHRDPAGARTAQRNGEGHDVPWPTLYGGRNVRGDEAALLEAIASFADDPKSLSTRGYLRALLGRLYLKWQPPRMSESRAELAAGREETIASGRHSTLPLVDSYWAQWLLADGSAESLSEADETLAKVATFGWARGEIASSSVRANIALARCLVSDALALSTHAVELLEEHGGSVPTVQSEQVFLVHARALIAAGSEGARGYAQKAETIIREKADSLPPSARTSFLERVQLSRDVLEIARSL